MVGLISSCGVRRARCRWFLRIGLWVVSASAPTGYASPVDDASRCIDEAGGQGDLEEIALAHPGRLFETAVSATAAASLLVCQPMGTLIGLNLRLARLDERLWQVRFFPKLVGISRRTVSSGRVRIEVGGDRLTADQLLASGPKLDFRQKGQLQVSLEAGVHLILTWSQGQVEIEVRDGRRQLLHRPLRGIVEESGHDSGFFLKAAGGRNPAGGVRTAAAEGQPDIAIAGCEKGWRYGWRRVEAGDYSFELDYCVQRAVNSSDAADWQEHYRYLQIQVFPKGSAVATLVAAGSALENVIEYREGAGNWCDQLEIDLPSDDTYVVLLGRWTASCPSPGSGWPDPASLADHTVAIPFFRRSPSQDWQASIGREVVPGF